ncbi:aminotransferase class IV [Caldisalinibacter kiritimatiensis]|uniref:aminotransferase class IV n=1 Tax=Caldisalinibacter kiritimatiensis TaxID=1304284 RepID=UPI0005554C58|nr:aminotransferase class IV [Caldisalinibacter kiritimatiensis]
MKNEAILDYYILNGDVYSTDNMDIFNQIGFPSIYEVIRVIDGIPLYFEDHIYRMRKSAELLGYEIFKSNEEIINQISRLIKVNNSPNLNIKLLCSNLTEKNQIILVYFIESHYPTKQMYNRGIHTILFNSERKNPNAKVVNTSFREKVNEKIKAEKAYEAILVNSAGYITEGSRSNIFFVKDNSVYTAPAGDVLLGVTRKRIVALCKNVGINVVEKNVHVDNLDEIDGLFMTGTSVNVLPITTIDNKKYDSVNNEIIKRIGEEYLQDVRGYINLKKKK